MKHATIHNLLIVILLALILSVPATSYAKSKKKTKEVTEKTVTIPVRNVPRDVQARYRYFFQGAITEKISKRYESAMELLRHCATIDPEAAETYFYMADCYDKLGKDSMQVVMLRKAAELRPDNSTYKEALVPILLQEGKLAEATSTIEELVKHHPERTDMLNVLFSIYNYQDNNDMCLSVLQRLEIQDGKREETTMTKVQILTRMKRFKEAYDELDELCKSHPLDLNYRVLFGNWLMGNKEPKLALAQYKMVLKEEPDNEDAMLSLYDYYRAEEQFDQADLLRDRLLLNTNTHDENRITMIKMWVRDNDHPDIDVQKMLNDFDRYAEVAANKQDILLLKAAYMDLKKMPEDSIRKVYQNIVELYPENSESRFHLIQSAWAHEDAKAIIEFSRPALEYDPSNWSFYYFLAIGLTLDKQYEECIEVINQGKTVMTTDTESDKTMASDMLEMLGDAYNALGMHDECFAAYDECLKYNPENIGCLNNYSYYLAEIDRDLEKAAAMSLRTVKQQPSNSTFLDTYAWVLYKLERYEEAAIYIDMAIQFLEEGADDTTYKEHSEAIHAKTEKK